MERTGKFSVAFCASAEYGAEGKETIGAAGATLITKTAEGRAVIRAWGAKQQAKTQAKSILLQLRYDPHHRGDFWTEDKEEEKGTQYGHLISQHSCGKQRKKTGA